MANFSFSIFGPEDGFKLFTVSDSGLSPDESFEINPSEFDFKTAGRLIQVIKLNGGVYISYHQQVLQVNSERPGYTFGEALYFENNNFDSSLIVESLSKLHAAFSHECLTDTGRFDGARFINFYKSTQATKYNILKEKISSNSYVSDKLIENIASQNTINGFYTCASLRDLVDVSRVVGWMVESAGSIRYSRLFIIDDNSGRPSEEFNNIINLDSENNLVLNSFYSSYKYYQQEYTKLEKIKSSLVQENNELTAKLTDLVAKVSSLKNSNQYASQANNVSIKNNGQNLDYLESSVDVLKSDIGKIKTALHKIKEDDLSKLGEDVVFTKAFAWVNGVLFFTLLFAVGYLIAESNSLHQKFIKSDVMQHSAIVELRKSIADLKDNSVKPVLPPDNSDGSSNKPQTKGKPPNK